MTPDHIIGVLAGLLGASLLLNAALWHSRQAHGEHHRLRTRAAEDAIKAAELRSAKQIDAMLDRVSTSPRLEVAPRATGGPLQVLKHIPDTPEADAAWNEFRGPADIEDES